MLKQGQTTYIEMSWNAENNKNGEDKYIQNLVGYDINLRL